MRTSWQLFNSITPSVATSLPKEAAQGAFPPGSARRSLGLTDGLALALDGMLMQSIDRRAGELRRLGDGNELARTNEAALAVSPADQGVGATQPVPRRIDEGLIRQLELAARDSLMQILLDRGGLAGAVRHGRHCYLIEISFTAVHANPRFSMDYVLTK